MAHTLFDELKPTETYYEESDSSGVDALAVLQDGQLLVGSIRKGEITEADVRAKVREFLEHQAQVVGTNATRPKILASYHGLDALSVDRIADGLEQIVNAMTLLFARVRAANMAASELLSG